MKIDTPTFLSETRFISASVVYSSGSQKFGNTMDDTHHFTGSLFITGSRIAIDDGNTNVFIGKTAGDSITTGANNVAIGDRAGTALTTGGQNVLIGLDAGDQIDGERDNVFIGVEAGAGAVNGADYCVGIGSVALGNAITQDGTIAIGK